MFEPLEWFLGLKGLKRNYHNIIPCRNNKMLNYVGIV